MRTENLFHEVAMNDEKKIRMNDEEMSILSAEQKQRFDGLVQNAGLLELQINTLIAEFERTHGVTCWISTEKNNSITVDIAVDKDDL